MADANSITAPDWTPSDSNGLRGVNPQDIMQRVAEGELLRDIAKDYGVSRSAVSHYIARNVAKDIWQAVREHSIQARLEDAESEFDEADDNVTLARAREKARLWMWRAEREFPHLYQQRPSTAVQINGADGMSVQIVSYADNSAAQHDSSSLDDNRTIIATLDDDASESHA